MSEPKEQRSRGGREGNSKARRKAAKCCRVRYVKRSIFVSVLGYLAKEAWKRIELGQEDYSQMPFKNLTELGIDIQSKPPSTYSSQPVGQDFAPDYESLSQRRASTSNADTTVVLLNWSRLPNIKTLVSLLCGPSLEDIIAEVFVWNNNPNITLSFESFEGTGCAADRLRLHNSPSNKLFEARYLACADARTPLCYVQDDDYVVPPETIRNLHHSFVNAGAIRSLHLAPIEEYVSTQLRAIHIPERNIHTSFAWLGYGTYFRKNTAIQFIRTLGEIGASEEEIHMADNYFTILGNEIPQVWMDSSIQMPGGTPFTIGAEGEARNTKHVARALRYLDEITAYQSTNKAKTISSASTHIDGVTRSPCRWTTCVLETNIRLLPSTLNHSPQRATEMLALERANRELIDEKQLSSYNANPLSSAIDGQPQTAFRSPSTAASDDWIGLDILDPQILRGSTVEMVFLVNEATEDLLLRSQFTYSADGENWTTVTKRLKCLHTKLQADNSELKECSVQVLDPGHSTNARYFRATLIAEPPTPAMWEIHGIWMRKPLHIAS